MAKEFKFDRNAALAVVGRAKGKEEGAIQEKPVSSIRRDYYDLQSGDLIELDKITRRVKRRLKEISNLNSKVFLDLYFAHAHWDLYSREKPFSAYLENEIQLSRSYAYGIIKGISCLHDYLSTEGLDGDEIIENVASIIDNVGISKVLKVANLKNNDDQSSWLNRLIDGEEIMVAQITEPKPTVARKEKEAIDDDITVIFQNGCELIEEGNDSKVILSFGNVSKDFQEYINKAVRAYRGSFWDEA